MTESAGPERLEAKLNQETARVAWQELQPFFARGQAVSVDGDLDLIAVAAAFARDEAEQLEKWRVEDRVHKVTDEQAANWFEAEQELWAVVVAPWVLLQPARPH